MTDHANYELVGKYAMAAEAYGNAVEEGDAEESNRQFQIIEDSFKTLKQQGAAGLESIAALLKADNPGVRLWSAAHLLNYPEYGSLLVLEKLKRSSSVLALTAEITLEQWRNGNLRY